MTTKTTDGSVTHHGACEEAVFSLRYTFRCGRHALFGTVSERAGLIRYGSGKDDN